MGPTIILFKSESNKKTEKNRHCKIAKITFEECMSYA